MARFIVVVRMRRTNLFFKIAIFLVLRQLKKPIKPASSHLLNEYTELPVKKSVTHF